MTLTKDQADELQDLAGQAAQRVSTQWPGTVEKDDLQQDIVLRLLESPGALGRLFEEDDKQVRQSFLIKLGHQLASETQQDYERFSGNYLYDVAQVRGYLEKQVWLTEDKVSIEKLDMEEAIGLLSEKNSGQYAALINRFVHDIVPESGSAEMKKTTRAVESLTELMNRIGAERKRNYTEGPGTRKVISNEQAHWRLAFANEER